METDVDNESVVILQAIIAHPLSSRHNKVLDKVRVISASPAVKRFVTGEVICGKDFKDVICELVLNGYQVSFIEPEYRPMSLLGFFEVRARL